MKNTDEHNSSAFRVVVIDEDSVEIVYIFGVGKNDPPFEHLFSRIPFLCPMPCLHLMAKVNGARTLVKSVTSLKLEMALEPGTLMLLGSGLLGLAFCGGEIR
ncbi:MAG: PEP-CTERM sorting domain-containing protein [Geobacter sp.]|nr:MAG: PEP-CTERM sorting domain-containing protein [Geobacter sp.]